MRVLKLFLLVLWVLATTAFIMATLTPLEFRNMYVGYICFFITFNGIFVLRFLLADFIRFKPSKTIVSFLLSLILAGTYAFLPGVNRNWKTQEIMYRQKDNPSNVIAFQMESKGEFGYDHRTVKLLRITPLFDWVTELKRVYVNESWVKANEFVNEMGIKRNEAEVIR